MPKTALVFIGLALLCFLIFLFSLNEWLGMTGLFLAGGIAYFGWDREKKRSLYEKMSREPENKKQSNE